MSKTKKTLALVMSFVLVIALTIVGTIAYLTSTPGAVKNTFTIGKVVITLDECAIVDEYGKEDPDANRVTGNEYKLIPGHTYDKDPTVHVQPGSEPCYVFVKVENAISALEAAGDTSIAAQIAANGWTALPNVTGVYYKTQAAVTGSTAVDLEVFATFTLDDEADVSEITDETIVITAYAIQQDGFTDASDAWTKSGFGA